MKKFQAEIDVMPKKEILDPQGKAVTGSMKRLAQVIAFGKCFLRRFFIPL